MTNTTPETARLTADVVLFSVREDRLYVLVIRRGWPPFKGLWALPGGHVDVGEDVLAAAHRELAEETGLHAGRLDPVGVYPAPGRDPRGRYVDFVYTATVPDLPQPVAGDDAAEARWIPVDYLLAAPGLAFDHQQIIHDALRHTL